MDADPDRLKPAAPQPEPAADDFLSRLALRLASPPAVAPRLGLRFAPTPDLPDEETVAWRRRFVDAVEGEAAERGDSG